MNTDALVLGYQKKVVIFFLQKKDEIVATKVSKKKVRIETPFQSGWGGKGHANGAYLLGTA